MPGPYSSMYRRLTRFETLYSTMHQYYLAGVVSRILPNASSFPSASNYFFLLYRGMRCNYEFSSNKFLTVNILIFYYLFK